jgi:hypothetical protein
VTDPTSLRTRAHRLAVWLSQPGGLATLFVVGFAIRIILSRGGAFPYDLDAFSAWAGRLLERGPWNFYPRGGEVYHIDQPPGYMYILYLVGRLARAFGQQTPSTFLLKLPPIFGDMLLAFLVMRLADRLAPAGVKRRLPVVGLAAAALLLNPAIFFISGMWVQGDVFLAVPVVGAFLLLGTGTQTFRREAGGVALLAIAVGTKPQAVFILPIVGVVLLWRHVRTRLASDENREAARRAAWRGIARVSALALVGAVAGQLLLAPFRLGPVQALEFYQRAARVYTVTSAFAFNLWGTISFWRPDSGRGAFRVLGIPALYVGTGLFVLGAIVVCILAWRALQRGEDEGRVLVVGGIALTLVSFSLFTRMHERYFFLALALAATLIGFRWMRRALIALSIAYFVNVLFSYVYYVDFVNRPVPLGGLARVLYGFVPKATDTNGFRLHLLSLLITAICLYIALFAWQGLRNAVEHVVAPTTPGAPDRMAEAAAVAGGGGPWTLRLHAVDGRAALIALAIFAVALVSRLLGLGHPPGMYFDEVYHARAGAEYIAQKEVFEYTHPPFAKELQALSINYLSGFGSKRGERLPSGFSATSISPRPGGVITAEAGGPGSAVRSSRIDGDCGLVGGDALVESDIQTDVVAADNTIAYMAGVASEGNVVARAEAGTETWRSSIPDRPREIALANDRTFLITQENELVTASANGDVETLATGAGHLSGGGKSKDGRSAVVWVTFPNDGRIASWTQDGNRESVVETPAPPEAIVALNATERVFVSAGGELLAIGSKDGRIQERIEGDADLLATVPETGLVWAASGRQLRAIEPNSAAVIGRATAPIDPDVLSADQGGHRLLAFEGDQMSCAQGRPQFAWRLPSAIAGGLIVAFVFLLSLRLIGNRWAALLAALFIGVDGLTFAITRIGTIDGVGTALLLVAWFCALSALFHWGRRATESLSDQPVLNRGRTIMWLFAGGFFAGLSTATKWTGFYAWAGIGLLFIADWIGRRERSIWFVLPNVLGPALVLFSFLALPLGVYVASFVPYFSLGHTLGDFLRLQSNIFNYHSDLNATHSFGSPWYQWPFGRKAVYLYVSQTGLERQELWTIPNLVVFWGGLVAMVAVVRRAVRTRSTALGLIAFAAIIQYVTWIPIGRVTFLYHYLPVVPFLAIALGWWLVVGLREHRYQREITIAFVTAAVAFFGLFLPMVEGWNMPFGYLDWARDFLPWVFQ